MAGLRLVVRPSAASSVSTTKTSTSECSVAIPRAAEPLSTMPEDRRVVRAEDLVERRLRLLR